MEKIFIVNLDIDILNVAYYNNILCSCHLSALKSRIVRQLNQTLAYYKHSLSNSYKKMFLGFHHVSNWWYSG